MESCTLTCIKHGQLNEIVCDACHTCICPECLEEHGASGHVPKYHHILSYSTTHVLPKVEKTIEVTKTKEASLAEESKDMITRLQDLAPMIVETITLHRASTDTLSAIISQVLNYTKQKTEEVYKDKIVAGLVKDKERLGALIKDKKTKETLQMVQKLEAQSLIAKNQETPKALLEKIKKALLPVNDPKLYQPLTSALGLINAKCNYLRMSRYTGGWKIDRQYLSTKMTLTEDNLTFGNSASSGYPGIIGDTPFDSGLYAFEVTPIHLDCTSKDGFGIIEREKYLSIYNADKLTPAIHEFMIGYQWKNVAKNMTAVKMADMVLNSKYYVKVNMVELTMKVFGPGVHLKTDLKAGMVYAPCFTCGCSSNKMKIRPLDSYDEVEDPI